MRFDEQHALDPPFFSHRARLSAATPLVDRIADATELRTRPVGAQLQQPLPWCKPAVDHLSDRIRLAFDIEAPEQERAQRDIARDFIALGQQAKARGVGRLGKGLESTRLHQRVLHCRGGSVSADRHLHVRPQETGTRFQKREERCIALREGGHDLLGRRRIKQRFRAGARPVWPRWLLQDQERSSQRRVRRVPGGFSCDSLVGFLSDRHGREMPRGAGENGGGTPAQVYRTKQAESEGLLMQTRLREVAACRATTACRA